MQFRRVLTASISIMERSTTLMHILSASVSLLIPVVCNNPCSLIYLVLDPNVKNAYTLDKWETDVYVEGMSQLEKAVSNSLPWPCMDDILNLTLV